MSIRSGFDLPPFSQSIFLGIPYAQPPIGDLRLRPPRSMYVYSAALPHKDNCQCSNESFGTHDATAYGPHCWSAFTTGLGSAGREVNSSI
jgi:carboxylesterase type B